MDTWGRAFSGCAMGDRPGLFPSGLQEAIKITLPATLCSGQSLLKGTILRAWLLWLSVNVNCFLMCLLHCKTIPLCAYHYCCHVPFLGRKLAYIFYKYCKRNSSVCLRAYVCSLVKGRTSRWGELHWVTHSGG